MLLGEVAEGMLDGSIIDSRGYFNKAFSLMHEKNHIKVRFAALEFVGMVAEDVPDYIEICHEKVVLTVAPLIQQNIPRIVVQACSCLVNVFESLAEDIIEDHSHTYVTEMCRVLFDTIITIEEKCCRERESALQVASAIAENGGDCVKEMYDPIFTYMARRLSQT